jgi:hypothetical protein
LSEYWWNFWDAFHPHVKVFWPLYALALSAVAKTRSLKAWPAALLGGWLLMSGLAISIGGYYRPHYLVLLATPLVLLAVTELLAVCRRVDPERARLFSGLISMLILAEVLVNNGWYYTGAPVEVKTRKLYNTEAFTLAPAIADLIAQHTAPEDRVFVFGNEPEIYYYAALKSALRYIYTYPLMIPSPSARQRQDEALAALRQLPPKILVACELRSAGWTPDSPMHIARGLSELVFSARYRLLAVVPMDGPDKGRIVSGKEMDAYRQASKGVFVDQQKLSMTLWQRV